MRDKNVDFCPTSSQTFKAKLIFLKKWQNYISWVGVLFELLWKKYVKCDIYYNVEPLLSFV